MIYLVAYCTCMVIFDVSHLTRVTSYMYSMHNGGDLCLCVHKVLVPYFNSTLLTAGDNTIAVRIIVIGTQCKKKLTLHAIM